MKKFPIYRLLFPFRTRLQTQLRDQRLDINFTQFAKEIGSGPREAEIARALWEHLREAAFVPSFLPTASDDLYKVYGMGPEEVRDDLFNPITTQLEIDVSHIDGAGFHFGALNTPRRLAKFMMAFVEGKLSRAADIVARL